MHELNHRTELVGTQGDVANKQNLRLLIALTLLIVAFAVVLVKDREFWFGSEQAVDSGAAVSESVAKTNSAAVPAKTAPVSMTRAATAKNHFAAKTTQPAVTEPAHKGASSSDSLVVASNRVVLPPLDVEVVAGDSHRTVHPGSNVAKLEITGGSNRPSAFRASAASLPASAAERERLSPVSAPDLRQNVDSTYPLLGQHTKVQGSVVLQAVVGADGAIEDLRVISGPAILATAAQQAVRQWRFKPYLQNGQPVETKTRITVNFSIRVSDNPATTS